MASSLAERIVEHLDGVARLRAVRSADAASSQRVLALKAYQARRFEATYADLLALPRYRAAARFFLDDLYGPQEFGERDAQFSRIVPALVRLFPQEIVETVEQLGQLHALTEALDDATARALPGLPVDAAGYLQAWQAVGRQPAREQQITLTGAIGQALDGYTRRRLLRTSLRLMRGPAQKAGLGALQRFLETGFDAFGAMQGADQFLAWVAARERALVGALFAPDAAAGLAAARATPDAAGRNATGPLGQLP